jgi:c-di-GMP-binding flagellar brake protein YcgR
VEVAVTERRKFLRFETALNALCDIFGSKTRTKVKNISKEGALILLDKPLEEGSELKLSMDVPGDNVPVFASCKVAWQKNYNDRSEYETGVRFTSLGSADRGRLLEYIYLEWLKVLDKK